MTRLAHVKEKSHSRTEGRPSGRSAELQEAASSGVLGAACSPTHAGFAGNGTSEQRTYEYSAMNAPEWTDEELRQLVEGVGAGLSYRQIGETIGRSAKSCNVKLNNCARESDRHEIAAAG